MISVDLERLGTDVDIESMREWCLKVYEHKKEKVEEKLRAHGLSEAEDRYLSALYKNISLQLNEYQKSIGLDG
ncbi:hypothetical protein DRN77_07760 [Methanosarcinales archaeon]|nr:MAG: hypothetical protein DRN77_07760 [Methanosarcinales archaeon]